MKIVIAKTAGFCMGVRRAVEMVLDASNSCKEKICTYGPLIHNPQVLKLLEDKGIPVIDEIPENGSGVVLIRAHGVPPKAKVKLSEAGFKIIDATCPRVIKVQSIIKKHAKKGYASIIIGDDNHPEVIGLLGYAQGDGYVVNTLEELEKLKNFDKAIIVAQTTQSISFFEKVTNWAKEKYPHYKVFNTICGSTEKRQNEIIKLSESSDAVVVVGGRKSGNTQRLAQIASQAGKKSFHIEDESELDLKSLDNVNSIAITAGASTPSWIIQNVYRALESSLLYKGKGKGFVKSCFTLLEYFLRTNLLLAVGAGSLCYASLRLQGIEKNFDHILISMCYVLSMHIINNITAINADYYNYPKRASFYIKHKISMLCIAIIAGVIGLYNAYYQGVLTFVILSFMSIAGLLYNFKFLQISTLSDKNFSLKDIPGSKTVLIALAWGVVTAILPAISFNETIRLTTLAAFFISFTCVFSRTAFFDILDMQGDRIVGKETIPILIGSKKTVILLNFILIFLIFMLCFFSIFNFISALGFALCLYPLLMLVVLHTHVNGHILPGFRLELLVESLFIIIGLIALF